MTYNNLHTITPYGRRGGSSRVRIFDWLDHLGLNAEIHDYLGLSSNRASILRHHGRDIARAELELRRLMPRLPQSTLWMSKQASPFSRGLLEATLLRKAGHAVYDFDDSLLDEAPIGRVQKTFRKDRIWRRAVAAADVVIAGNDYLANQAADFVNSNRIVVIPSCVEPNSYRIKEHFEIHGNPRAVWLGSPSTEPYLKLVQHGLLQAHQTLGLRLTVISSGNSSLGALDSMIDRLEWTPEANQRLADYDFGIMPLQDTPQARGKCAYKLLQYGASALPSLASPVGANIQAMENGIGTPALADNWLTKIHELTSLHASDRKRLGLTAHSGVCGQYSFGSHASTMERQLNL